MRFLKWLLGLPEVDILKPNIPKIVQSIILNPQTKKIADLGCGDGIYLFAYSYIHSDTYCVGFDISPCYPHFFSVDGIYNNFKALCLGVTVSLYEKENRIKFEHEIHEIILHLNYRFHNFSKEEFHYKINHLLQLAERNSALFEVLLKKVDEAYALLKASKGRGIFLADIFFKSSPSLLNLSLREFMLSKSANEAKSFFQPFLDRIIFCVSYDITKHLPLPDSSFDLVFLNAAPDKGRNEAIRISKDKICKSYSDDREVFEFYRYL